MALTILQEKKKQQYLLLALLVLLLAAVFVWWWWFLKGTNQTSVTVSAPTPPRPISINFELLGNDILKKLQLFEEILPLQGGSGRTNPYIPF